MIRTLTSLRSCFGVAAIVTTLAVSLPVAASAQEQQDKPAQVQQDKQDQVDISLIRLSQ